MRYADPNVNRRKRLSRDDRRITRCPQCGDWMWKQLCRVHEEGGW